MAARYLADLSALARLHHDEVRAVLEPLVVAGRVATSTPVSLALLSRARRPADYAALAEDLACLPQAPLGEAGLGRALEVQALLASSGRHRAVGAQELMVAAAAERAGLTVLHYEPAFDLIAQATGQPVDWVARRGSLP